MQPLNFAGKKKEAFFTRVVRSGENLVNPAVPLLQICYRRWVILAARYLGFLFADGPPLQLPRGSPTDRPTASAYSWSREGSR